MNSCLHISNSEDEVYKSLVCNFKVSLFLGKFISAYSPANKYVIITVLISVKILVNTVKILNTY